MAAVWNFAEWCVSKHRVRLLSMAEIDRVSPQTERFDLRSEISFGSPGRGPLARPEPAAGNCYGNASGRTPEPGDFLKCARGSHFVSTFTRRTGSTSVRTSQQNEPVQPQRPPDHGDGLAADAGKSGRVSLTASYADKFGPLGKIAVVLGESRSRAAAISSWVMSCRAFSRRVEYATLSHLFESMNLDKVLFHFEKTERNTPLQEFFASLGIPDTASEISRSQFEARCPPLSLWRLMQRSDLEESCPEFFALLLRDSQATRLGSPRGIR